MTNADPSGDDPFQPRRLSEAITALAVELRDRYLGTFISNQLGEHLLYADAFTRLAQPHLPPWLRRDAELLRGRIDVELRRTLAVCILSLEDVTGGPPMADDKQQYELTSEQTVKVWYGYYTQHFPDILCDTQFWVIVDALRDDIGLDAPAIA